MSERTAPSVTPSSSNDSPAPAPTDDLGQSARRGALFIPLAKLWFLVSALLLQLLLPRALGSSALYGVWTLVSSWLSTFNNVMITATIQAVAYFAARGPSAVEHAKATALRMNLLIGGGSAALFFLAAPAVASFEHDAELTAHLQLGSLIILGYSFYAVFVGAANGARQFHKQAGLDITFATLRTGLVLASALVLHSTLAAIGGWVLAAMIILVVAVALVGLPKPVDGEPIPVKTMLGFGVWLAVYLLGLNSLMFMDGWWLKRLYTEALVSLPAAEVKRTVDAVVGVYGAAQTVARLPYQLIVAVTFIVFPLLSAPAVQADRQRTERYISATLRYSLIAMMGLVTALGVRPQGTLRLLFPPEYMTGSSALAILLGAYVCFSLFSIVGTITNSLGRTLQTTALGLSTLALTALSVYFSITSALQAGEQPLRAAALGMLIGMGSGLLLGLTYLWVTLRATLPVLTLLRTGLGFAVAMLLGRIWPAAGSAGLLGSKLGTLVCAALAGVVYLAVLLATRELSLTELALLRRERPKATISEP
ncbi:MAG: oligosaccharide flippase family protein [Myxococcales bacterium]|nr:oligosaccharide flippase family protein [Myxococcales bacterium]